MDHFGIGQGIKGAVIAYFVTSRQTGRTVSLIESVKTGDRVCFTNEREARRVKGMCKDRGIDIDTVVINPKCPERLFECGSVAGEGRMIFDHTWVEEYYLNAINACQMNIDRFQQELSGYGEAHRESKRRAIEMSKWRP